VILVKGRNGKKLGGTILMNIQEMYRNKIEGQKGEKIEGGIRKKK
jgi:hypothetical protein